MDPRSFPGKAGIPGENVPSKGHLGTLPFPLGSSVFPREVGPFPLGSSVFPREVGALTHGLTRINYNHSHSHSCSHGHSHNHSHGHSGTVTCTVTGTRYTPARSRGPFLGGKEGRKEITLGHTRSGSFSRTRTGAFFRWEGRKEGIHSRSHPPGFVLPHAHGGLF